jgi:lipopolysaccharide transport system ATP-binding protein
VTAPVIRVDGVTKAYVRGRHTTLKDLTVHGWRRAPRERIVALRDVSFDVPAGRTLGLIGHNGAGKSTLLRLLGGVGKPDTGTISMPAKVSGLFELGTGLHPELTGRECILVTGVLAGLTRAQVRARTGDIVDFAEIGAVIDEPTRTYSTGMQSRLAFATAVHVDAEVLLVDEILAVGDIAFQTRCLDRIRAMQSAGVTVVVVSHDPALIDDICDEVVWLQGGRLIGQGKPREVTRHYRAAMEAETRCITPIDAPVVETHAGLALRARENRFGSLEAQITEVATCDAWGLPADRIAPGDAITLHAGLRLRRPDDVVQVNAVLLRDDGLMCVDTSTAATAAGTGVRATLTVGRLDLAPGRYAWNVGIYAADWSRTLDFHWQAYPLEITGERAPTPPALTPPLTWSTAPALPPPGLTATKSAV